MTDYGVQPTGYVRKPISIILAELEAAMITEFGPGVIQTPQSPLGQLNGLAADLVAEVDERNLDLYQSYDPDQAEGTRLDTLGRLRLLSRGADSDAIFRRVITNQGQARVDIQDLVRAIAGLSGVTYSQVFVNETGEVTEDGPERGSVSVAVIGGDDAEIASAMRRYIVPGINTYGNALVTSNIDGFCRSMSIIRPTEVVVTLRVTLRTSRDKLGCPAPSVVAVKDKLLSSWLSERINGQDVSFYSVRSIIESNFSNVEVVSIQGSRDSGTLQVINTDVDISFLEIASLTNTSLTVELQ